MQAETLNCPNCGAASSTDAPRCQYCTSRLATLACSSCFGLIFQGSRHCPRCGVGVAEVAARDLPDRNCPRCRLAMQALTIGATAVRECSACLGLWVDVAAFEKICVDREQQAAVLGGASIAPHPTAEAVSKVSYIPCPECSQLMNRINFARCSGVVVDFCKGHGTWFDRDELTRIVEFIRSGGLEASRNKELAQLEESRRQLEVAQMSAESRRALVLETHSEDHRISGIASVGGLLKILLG